DSLPGDPSLLPGVMPYAHTHLGHASAGPLPTPDRSRPQPARPARPAPGPHHRADPPPALPGGAHLSDPAAGAAPPRAAGTLPLRPHVRRLRTVAMDPGPARRDRKSVV